jgi:hypothetical protein
MDGQAVIARPTERVDYVASAGFQKVLEAHCGNI